MQYPQLQRDLSDVKGRVRHVETLDEEIGKSLIESVPMFRRLASVPKRWEEKDYLPAVGAVGVAAVLIPSDLEDIKDAIEHGKGLLGQAKYKPDYDHRATQHDFSFLRGSFVEKWGKNTKRDSIRNTIERMIKHDKSLDETRVGAKVRGWLGISVGDVVGNSMKTAEGRGVFLSEIKSKGLFGDLTARALKRTTIFGLCALGLLELPDIIKSMGKGKTISEQAKNTAKQTVDSGINIASIAAGVGYGGAIGSKYGGAIGSLVGMGCGAVFGSLLAGKAQEVIN